MAIGGVIYGVKDFFLHYTYPSSWFFPALMLSVPIVYGMNKVSKLFTSIVLLMLYVYLAKPHCLLFEYVPDIYDWYDNNIAAPNCSVIGALFWVELGYLLAMKKFQELCETVCNKYKIVTCIIAVVLATFTLWFRPLAVVMLVIAFQDIKTNFNTTALRKYSTLIYCYHYALIFILWRVPIIPHYGYVMTILAFTLATLIAIFIVKASEYDKLKILKYVM